MNGIQNGKTRNLEKPFPGCLGRMVNLFDVSSGVAGNRLLTDKPHRDGSPLLRSRSDVARTSPSSDQIDDKVIESELRRTSNRKSGTPMKMLIAQEMSKEVEYKHNAPGVVAKLMGLDTLPQQQHDSFVKRSHSRVSTRSHSDIPMGYWQQEHGFFDMQIQRKIHQGQKQNEYKDVHEIWQRSQKGFVRDGSPQKGRHAENLNDKKMALVRQKFIEAKHLATDEKLRQSKQFQDALDVLTTNKDLLLKFLQEPNSLFSRHLNDLRLIPPPPESKRITVLRPSKMVDSDRFSGSEKKSEKQVKKNSPYISPTHSSVDDNPTQPTRIIVLKPSPGKPHDFVTAISPPSSSPRTLHGEELCSEQDDDEVRESREDAKEITGHQRDETLVSSVCSNGYVGDESSFNKSESEFVVGNFSDSEVMSPPSRHSWDYTTKYGSPFSSSSFSRASCSPESSVCREAKKRLSERWAMMASNGGCQEQRHVRRSSSTLGEMLALSDIKNHAGSEKEVINKEREPKESISCLNNDLNKDESVDNSPRNLLRSKSVPVSSTVNGTRLNVEVSGPEVVKTDDPKEVRKTRSMKSSFKGKVSSLFFSRNKKSCKEKPNASQSETESQTSAGTPVRSPGNISDGISQCCNDSGLEEGVPSGLHGSFSKFLSPELAGVVQKQASEGGLSPMKHVASVNLGESPDQPSPISVLEPPFQEDDNTTLSNMSRDTKPGQQGANLLSDPIKPNLIDKSPPIGSISRTLSWGGSCLEAATPYLSKPSIVCQAEEEEEWLLFVRKLLSVAGFDGDTQTDSFFAKWHSPESPLDPSLREKYSDPTDRETVHEARRRQRRSIRKLVFDCVNAALVDISCGGVHDRVCEGASTLMVDRVWARLKGWFNGDVRCVVVDGCGGDSDSLVVESVVRKEVVGKGWVEGLKLEIDNIGKEIEGKLLEELVVELTGRL